MKSIGINLILSLVFVAVSFAQTPRIVSVTPSQYELSASGSTNISVTFDVDMDEETFNESTFIVNARSTGNHYGEIIYDDMTRTATIDPYEDFDVGEEITVTLSTQIRSGGGEPLPAGYLWFFTVEVDDGTGEFILDSEYIVGGDPNAIFFADFDNDGDNDIACAKWTANVIAVLLNNGDGTFADQDEYPTGTNAVDLFAAELNGDGYIDLVSANAGSDNISVLINLEGNGFAAQRIYSVGSYPASLFVVDYDGDGYNDVATVNFYGSNMSILFNNGNGEFGSRRSSYNVGMEPRAMYAADFDNDGDIDLISSNNGSNNLKLLFNDGHGDFSTSETFSITNPVGVNAADLNADGYPDLIVANYYPGNIVVFLNRGDGSFGRESFYSVGERPYFIKTGDFDGDGDLDIITDRVGGYTAVILNYGDGTFGYARYFINARAPRVADIDGDGDLDFACLHNGPEKIFILLNENSTGIEPYIEVIPERILLGQNYPNPFNAMTTITFSIPGSGNTSVRIYDLKGRSVKTLLSGMLDEGRYHIIWDGTNHQNEPIVSGVYFYTLEILGEKITKRTILLK